MKTIKTTLISFLFVLFFNSCKEYHNEIPIKNKYQSASIKDSLFIGVKLIRTGELEIGFTSTDSQYLPTDTVPGDFVLENNDIPASAYDKLEKTFYFMYKQSNSSVFHIGVVDAKTGKFVKSINTSIIHNYNPKLSANFGSLYIFHGSDIYEIDKSGGINLLQDKILKKMPPMYSACINKYYFFYLDGKFIKRKNRITGTIDSIELSNNLPDQNTFVQSDDTGNIIIPYVSEILFTNFSNHSLSKKPIRPWFSDLMAYEPRNVHSSGIFFDHAIHASNHIYSFKYPLTNYAGIADLDANTMEYCRTPSWLVACLLK